MSSKFRPPDIQRLSLMLMVHRANGTLVIKDYGGWALRNESMSRMLRELDAAGALPKEFPPLCIQTGDRCIIKRTGESEDGVELHLWQSQPVDDELRARLPLCRVLSMCSTPKCGRALLSLSLSLSYG